jgi:hypothetical protein
VSSRASTSHLAGALAPAKLRKDGIRLGLIAVLSILYAIAFEQPVVDVLLIGVNGFGVLIGTLAVAFAAFAIRRHGRAAALALAVYGACTAAHLAAIILLLGH